MSAATEIDRVRALVEPIVADLRLDLYDVERRGGTIRVTLDAAPDGAEPLTLDNIALATRLISRELDHADPIAGRYTLEVSTPGLERQLRTPEHFARSVGATVALRLRDVASEERRVEGTLAAADDDAVTVELASGDQRRITYSTIDKARTVFDWDEANTKSPATGREAYARSKHAAKRTAAGDSATDPSHSPSHPSEEKHTS
jgi:ribosome maturation factor RimP